MAQAATPWQIPRSLGKHGRRLGYRLGELGASLRGAPRPRIIFLHIPKSAGSTVTHYFRQRVGTIRSGRMTYLFDAAPDDWERRVEAARRARYVAGHFGGCTLERIRNGAFVFTFLREPRARLRSHFKYFSGIGRPEEQLPTRDYLEFLTMDHPLCEQGRDNVMTRQLAAAYSVERARSVARPSWPAMARETLRRMDHVGFQDRFDDDFAALLDRLGLARGDETASVNTTDGLADRGLQAGSIRLTDAVLAAEDRCLEMDLALWSDLRGQPPP